ncbi:MAG: YbjN domain-containing protein [Bacteroidales bacterium]|nr:YbjN domain-containing protein [Bacteroidales bacterium]
MNIKEQIVEFLSKQGLRPEIEDDAIYFRYQMLNYYIQWDEEDANFLQIALPGVMDTDDNNRIDALEACNAVNDRRKVVKAVITPRGKVWILAEQLLDQDPALDDVIPRTINMLMQAYNIFLEEMRK